MAFSRSAATLVFAVATNLAVSDASDAPAALRGAVAGPSTFVAPAAAEVARKLSGDIQYDHYFDKNAFAPYGATDIDSDATAPSGLTPQQCEERCTADANCMCVTQERATGKCWKRANCDPSQWTSEYNAGYNVYMKRGYGPSTPTPSTGSFRLMLYTNQNKCLDVKDHKTYNGNMVQLRDCIGSGNDQYWISDNGPFDINANIMWAPHPEKCLDVKDHQTSNGTPLQIWDCLPGDFDQEFYLDTSFRPVGSESLPVPVGRLRWKDHPSKCVVAQDGGDWNGNAIVLADCVDSQDNQYWVDSYVER